MSGGVSECSAAAWERRVRVLLLSWDAMSWRVRRCCAMRGEEGGDTRLDLLDSDGLRGIGRGEGPAPEPPSPPPPPPPPMAEEEWGVGCANENECDLKGR